MKDANVHSKIHASDEFHHHHGHSEKQKHPGGHHLLFVDGLSVGFKMYEDTAGDGLRAYLSAPQREVFAVHDLTISVHAGEVVAVVGASGSGKTLLADSILGLFQPNAIVSGSIWFDGVQRTADELARLRGHGISLIPQSVESLDPLMRVGKQVIGPGCKGWQARRAKQSELFERYGLAPEVERAYPFQLSGGMARRVLFCCAMMDDPKLIIADEPTPGLDAALADQVMGDLRQFADEGGGVLLITHDIELALRSADRVAVFKDGTVVEEALVASFASPDLLAHPFSKQLWHALPEHGFSSGHEEAPC
ncbi:MAG: ABC transporter ATP-binding protein [Eggerthellaceae bacterium]|nr:ABC transporter ATP-binding protein [Eggerthellaceae bacterium]